MHHQTGHQIVNWNFCQKYIFTFIVSQRNICILFHQLFHHVHVGNLDSIHEWSDTSITLQVNVCLWKVDQHLQTESYQHSKYDIIIQICIYITIEPSIMQDIPAFAAKCTNGPSLQIGSPLLAMVGLNGILIIEVTLHHSVSYRP